MRLRTSDAPDGEGGNKWQRTGISDGLLTPIARAAEADPVSSPEGWGCFLSDQWLRFSFLQRTNESSCYGPHAIAIQSDRRSAINLRWIFLMPYYRVYRVYRLENVHPLGALPLGAPEPGWRKLENCVMAPRRRLLSPGVFPPDGIGPNHRRHRAR